MVCDHGFGPKWTAVVLKKFKKFAAKFPVATGHWPTMPKCSRPLPAVLWRVWSRSPVGKFVKLI